MIFWGSQQEKAGGRDMDGDAFPAPEASLENAENLPGNVCAEADVSTQQAGPWGWSRVREKRVGLALCLPAT